MPSFRINASAHRAARRVALEFPDAGPVLPVLPVMPIAGMDREDRESSREGKQCS